MNNEVIFNLKLHKKLIHVKQKRCLCFNRDDTHTTSTLGGNGKGKNEMLSDVGGCGVNKYSGRPIFIFFIKENWICAITRHDGEPNINRLLTINLPFDSEVGL